MEANEWMIGDWVYNTHHRQNEQVEEIGSNCVMLAYNDLYAFDEIEPIPLTVEILDKNGLEKDNHGLLYGEYFDEDKNKDLEISVDSKTGEIWWSYNWDEYHIIRLRYVHELQRALRLCGIEKEITI